MGNALDKWTERNVRDMKIATGQDFAESPVGEAMMKGEEKIRSVVEGTFDKMKPAMEKLAENVEKLRQQDLRQAAEV